MISMVILIWRFLLRSLGGIEKNIIEAFETVVEGEIKYEIVPFKSQYKRWDLLKRSAQQARKELDPDLQEYAEIFGWDE